MHQFSSLRNVIVLSFCAIVSSSIAGPLPPSQLRCEYLKNLEAVDVAVPRFAWVLNHTDRAQKQTAYELQVFYNVLAGIDRGEGPAYGQIRIQPQLVHGLNWVSAETATPHGQITSAWKRLGMGYKLKVEIPVGTEATVYLPLLKLTDPAVVESGKTVYLDGKAQAGLSGISPFTKLGDRLVGKVGSGTYVFTTGEREQIYNITGGSIYV